MHDLCTICHTRPTEGPTTHACTACLGQLADWLTEIPRHLPYLQASLQHDRRPAQGSTGGRAHSPAPLRLDVLSLLAAGSPVPLDDPHGDQTGHLPITPLLHGWAQRIASTHPAARRDHHGTARIDPCTAAAPRHGLDITAWCTWLTAYLPYAAGWPWIVHLYDDLARLVAAIRAITHTTPRRRTLAAPCPRTDCQAWALSELEWSETITCEACGARMTQAEYAAYAAAVLHALQTGAETVPAA